MLTHYRLCSLGRKFMSKSFLQLTNQPDFGGSNYIYVGIQYRCSKPTNQPAINRMNKLLDEYTKAFGTEADLLYSQVKLALKLRDIPTEMKVD